MVDPFPRGKWFIRTLTVSELVFLVLVGVLCTLPREHCSSVYASKHSEQQWNVFDGSQDSYVDTIVPANYLTVSYSETEILGPIDHTGFRQKSRLLRYREGSGVIDTPPPPGDHNKWTN